MPVRATLGHLVGESLADGLTAIKAVQPAGQLVARLASEYRAAQARVAA